MCPQINEKPLTKPASMRKRELVIDAARRVFMEQGYGDASMDRIAEEAAVSKRTVYNHFESKQELFSAVITLLCENVMPPTGEAKTKADWSQKDYLGWLAVKFLQRIYSRDQIELYRTIIAESRNFPDLGIRFFDGPVSDSERVIYSYLVSQIKTGALAITNPATAASQFLGMLKSDMHMKLLMGKRKRIGSAEIEQIARSTVDLFLNGARGR